jgi:hypothetical protein
MPLFRKEVLRPGVYTTPSGTAVITPTRIRHWADTFKQMAAAGLKLPCPWGHQRSANPVDPEDQDAEDLFHKTRFNAGFLEDLSVAPDGSLMALLDIPDAADAARVGKSIKEVSIAVMDWKDGSGRLWRDAPRHLALVTLPVAHGMGDFEPVPGEMRFSLADRDEPEEEPARESQVERVVRLLEGAGIHLPLFNDRQSPYADNAFYDALATALHAIHHRDDSIGVRLRKLQKRDRPAKPRAGDAKLGKILDGLEIAGVHLPRDVTRENFLAVLEVALTALAHHDPDRSLLRFPKAEPDAELAGHLTQLLG